jgi:hypothetical protein
MPNRVETKIFIFVFSRKFIFAFRKKSLRKVMKTTKTFAKTKMYEKTDAGNGKYCEISEDVKSGWCFKKNRTTVMDISRKFAHFCENGKNRFRFNPNVHGEGVDTTDISQYRLRFGSSRLYKSVFHLNCLTAQLSYEGRAAVEGGK